MKAGTATPVFPISEQYDGFDFDPEKHYAEVLAEARKKPPSSSNGSNPVIAGNISSSKLVDVDKSVADVKKKRSWKNALFFWKKLSGHRKQEKEQCEVQARPRRSGFKSRSGPIYMNDFHVEQPRRSTAAHSGPLSGILTPREGDLVDIPYVALKHPNHTGVSPSMAPVYLVT